MSSVPTFVVAVDFSETSRQMLEVAIREAQAHDARIVLVHAFHGRMKIGMVYRDAALDPIRELEQELKLDEAVELSTEWAEVARQAGVDVETVAREETPASLILDVADEVDADRIIMGRAGHGAIAEFVMGSTSKQVVKKAKVPVLVVPKQ